MKVKIYKSPILQPSEQHRLLYRYVAVCYMFRHDLVILWQATYGQYGVFGTATRLRAGRSGVRIPAGARNISFSKSTRPTVWPTQVPIRWVGCAWNVMTRAETTFHISAKRTSLFKSVGASVQSTTGSRGVRISGSNAGYTMFRGSVKGTGYPLHSPVFPSLPLPCVTVCHHISTGLYQGCFLGVKRSGRDVDQSPPSCTEIWNEWSYVSTPVQTFMAWTATAFTFNFIAKASVGQ